MTTRREFLKTSAAVGGALGAGIAPRWASASEREAGSGADRGRAQRPLRILILGGTGFIGPHLVNVALGRGHELTLFNRGRSEPRLHVELFDGLENLIGDRNGDISSLEGREWDAVIDDSGYTPEQVRATAQLLKGSVDQYLFTSTRAVYPEFTAPDMHEDRPIGLPGVPEEEWEGYGPEKALAEREVREAFPGGTTITRPSIIVGPGDSSDRFTYWFVGIDEGGEVLAPGDPTDPVQYIDVRDLAEFYVHLLEQGTRGTFNLLGPAAPLSVAELLYGIRAVTPARVSFTWVDWGFLDARGVEPWSDLPGWRPPRGDFLNYGRMNNTRALDAGLTIRPLAETAADTLAWWKTLPAERRADLRAGIPAARERELLEAWRRHPGRG